ncbi:hypothetical protein MANES_05G103450v8 [Manihot esculenta]|uniref:Uncharacterized protein n=1 Tax=Manihot esculenta TaxID=3983 RepID=A0ACB7HTE9_MANES|nr:hypothetical protein MANES_05G103450v8 [Manihot esculenta]
MLLTHLFPTFLLLGSFVQQHKYISYERVIIKCFNVSVVFDAKDCEGKEVGILSWNEAVSHNN